LVSWFLAEAPLFLFLQRSGMDYVNRFVLIQDENHLEKSAAPSSTPNEPFVPFHLSREGPPRTPNHHFRFFGGNSMLADMCRTRAYQPDNCSSTLSTVIANSLAGCVLAL